MKLSLVVETAGKSKGKVIPVTLSKFLIGRDPDCHLRPASTQISKRHCALVVRGDKVFVHDFNSTNGTLVNNRLVRGEIELAHLDRLKVGPLEFSLRFGASTPADAPTPLPPGRSPGRPADEDAMAALLLSLDGEGAGPQPPTDAQGVPEGSTEIKLPALEPSADGQHATRPDGAVTAPGPAKAPPKAPAADTSAAARSILDKYLRRQR